MIRKITRTARQALTPAKAPTALVDFLWMTDSAFLILTSNAVGTHAAHALVGMAF